MINKKGNDEENDKGDEEGGGEVDDIVRQVIAENPIQDVGIRNEWYEHVGWHRKEDIRSHDTNIAPVDTAATAKNNRKVPKHRSSSSGVDTDHRNNNLRGRIGSFNPGHTATTTKTTDQYIVNPIIPTHVVVNVEHNLHHHHDSNQNSESIFSTITTTTTGMNTPTSTVWLGFISIIILMILFIYIWCLRYTNRVKKLRLL
jgi:hypothetical protein